MPRYSAYVICTSPRSGSTLLCSLLEASGAAGAPASYFHRPSVQDWAQGHGVSLGGEGLRQRVFDAAACAGRAGGDIFGLRLQQHSAVFLFDQMSEMFPGIPTDASRFEARFGKTLFLHLTRADKLAQAVSFLKAQQSGLWHQAPDGREIERLNAPRPLRYDREAIAKKRDEFRQMDQFWEDWFQNQGIAPLQIDYDALARDPMAVLNRVLGALGQPAMAAGSLRPAVARLSDQVNRDWIARFRAETGD